MVQLDFNSSSKTKKKGKQSGDGCAFLFGVVFMLIGLIVTGFTVKGLIRDLGMRGWDKAPALVGQVDIKVEKDNDDPFVLRVNYFYEVDGKSYTGDRYRLRPYRSDNYEKLALVLKDLNESPERTARVDPDDPASAVLNIPSPWSALTVFLPLIFVVVGGAIAYAALKSMRHKKKGRIEAISSSPTGQHRIGWVILVCLGIGMLIGGLACLGPLGLRPFQREKAAASWPAVPCKIIWAKVKSHDSDDGTTYSVDIFYSYKFEGRPHRSNRYSFVSGSSSGRGPKQKIVQSYREAKSPVCYVDPTLPERAVLKRELGAGKLLALVPLALLGIGTALTFFGIKSLRKMSRTDAQNALSGQAPPTPGLPVHSPDSTATRTLTPTKSRIGAVFGLLFAAIFWNGIVFGFLFPEAWLENGGIFLKLFSVPFMVLGIAIVAGFFHALLALLNPKPRLELSPGALTLGQPFSVNWRLTGSTGRVRRVRIILRGVEKATYQRGSNSTTETETFFAALLDETTDAISMRGADVTGMIPTDCMHSFDATSNKIVWYLEVRGDLPFWPDISDTFEVDVHPLAITDTPS